MNPKTIARMARPLKARIGAHYRMLSEPMPGQDVYAEARRDSDEAIATAKYLIQHLANRHDATLFASFVGLPGYIHTR